ncbi:TetR/AcrR family transcriptional regulator [Streptomyces hoynatensis]|uniref:TetR/AcrR family transcriptional regulator n=1 Tax=Streptomyces hoynatensis TaxID=1141874 RepID=A0A3A9YMQ0_9ACTN|nr:TetR/AcrR family transcriptional regulator [Streptomyces hoynatensis]RKN37501.1 TetR/AcrR family transcriptional regulator [Streptomyces hoynatensis]
MTQEARPLRADARRNRARVLDAAEAVLAAQGVGASMRAIAREANLGLGTIYRHFPTREALFQAILANRARRMIAHAAALREAPDPGEAFFGFFAALVAESARKKAMVDVLAAAGIDPKAGASSVAEAMREAIAALLGRAQRAGAVRADLGMAELLAILGGLCLGAERDPWPDEVRARVLAITFDGFRPR